VVAGLPIARRLASPSDGAVGALVDVRRDATLRDLQARFVVAELPDGLKTMAQFKYEVGKNATGGSAQNPKQNIPTWF
jgi:hypothetical protein